MKRIATILLLSLTVLTAAAARAHDAAPRGWILWSAPDIEAVRNGLDDLPACCRIEVCTDAAPTLRLVNTLGERLDLCKAKGRKRTLHRYAIEIDPDAKHADACTVRQYADGILMSTRHLSGQQSPWRVEGADERWTGQMCIYVRDPNHRISASRLDFSPEADRFISDLLGRMTLAEKIGQLSQYVGSSLMTGPRAEGLSDSLFRHGLVGSVLNASGSEAIRSIQEKNLALSRLKIPVLFGMDVIHGYRTLFPVPLAEACSWDLEAIRRSARWAAVEASAAGIHWTFAPMVDITRDARWGRIVEGAGEDPFLGSRIAAARVEGFQWNLWQNNSVMACAKHWLAYGFPQSGRDYAPVDISPRTLFEVCLPPFKACVDAGVMTFMSAFNDLNGVPASGHPDMLRKYLQETWKFQGFVVSDWKSVEQLVAQGVAEDGRAAARIAFNAGVDMDMIDGLYNRYLGELVAAGQVDEKSIDEAVTRILRVKYSLGLFDDPYKYLDAERERTTLHAPKIVDAALDMARRSIVLLENNGILPLADTLRSIALIGPLADDRHEINGSWRCRALDADAVTIREGLTARLGKGGVVNYARGCGFDDTDRTGFAAAVEAARKSDAVVVAVGEKALFSGESRSRASLDLPGVQEELVMALIATGKPVVVVLLNGRPLTIGRIAEKAAAVVEAWFPGTTTGTAVAEILFGDYNPSARLAVSFPRSVGQIPCYYNYKRSGRPGDMPFSSTVRHIDLPNAPLYPFGYGLSYTEYTYSAPTTDKRRYSRRETIRVSVDVTNSGTRDGEETVQVYVSDPVASLVRPVKELKGFRKVFLKAGETRRVCVDIDPLSLGFYDLKMNYTVEKGRFDILVGPDSERLNAVSIELID